ncbi:hypothetical protein PCL_07686 [Purpureocillium lilacinum]|uniref:Uncharacterized protein n=1 Tax=Purpureocillium lilacinum TaxID=33203 RepID=A0A2U3EIR4_PURLI|nr:hypothetical protein PCL_07686 [Purpureocillium lilacinum]GJN68422.1 hypothetical protein PLICBS_002465 [Purpureocillium lilacinum]
MRFATVILSGALALVASAQSDTSATQPATPTRTLSPAESSAAACLSACKPGDVDCQSHCITVPSPDKDAVDRTTKCAAACVQGDGSKAQTEAYAACQQKCIRDNFYESSAGTPKPTGGSGGSDNNSGSSTGSDASQTSGGSGSDSASGTGATATKSGATGTGTAGGSSSTSTGLAPMLTAAPAAVVGLVAAVLAL